MRQRGMDEDRDDGDALGQGRRSLLIQLEDWLERPMMLLGLGWLVLIALDLTGMRAPALSIATDVIWILFILDFLLRFTIAPEKGTFLRANILTLVSLLVPALRLFRATRILVLARAGRGVRLVRLLGSLNRGLSVLRGWLRRRRLGFVLALTVMVVLLGAAGMYALERDTGSAGFASYGESLWWTAMLITSIGSADWPATLEGRLLCLLLSIYGLGMFGYIAGSFASLFIGQDAGDPRAPVAGNGDAGALRQELAALRAELRATRLIRPRPGRTARRQPRRRTAR